MLDKQIDLPPKIFTLLLWQWTLWRLLLWWQRLLFSSTLQLSLFICTGVNKTQSNNTFLRSDFFFLVHFFNSNEMHDVKVAVEYFDAFFLPVNEKMPDAREQTNWTIYCTRFCYFTHVCLYDVWCSNAMFLFWFSFFRQFQLFLFAFLSDRSRSIHFSRNFALIEINK